MKRWKVEIAGQREAVLQLSAVNLPGGVQRMRTYEDQLSMRTLFSENDLVGMAW
jgi:exosome complex component RRP4